MTEPNLADIAHALRNLPPIWFHTIVCALFYTSDRCDDPVFVKEFGTLVAKELKEFRGD